MKKWIIGNSLALREEDIGKIEIIFENNYYQAMAYSKDDIHLALLAMAKDRDVFFEELNKILN